MRRLTQCLKTMSIFGALLSCAANARAADQPVTDEVQGARDPSARLTVPVEINGGGPYHFVVDTGAERTVISRELADRLTLAPAGAVTLLSISGLDQVETALVPDLKLTSSRSRLSDLQAPVLSELNLGAVGMLGIDSLQTKRVVMDFHAMHMSISDASRPAVRDENEIIVTARRRLGQLILVDADVNGQKVSVIIDTGSAVTMGNPMLRARLLERNRLGLSSPISIMSVTGTETLADYTSIRRIRIGGVTMTDMPIAFADLQIFHRLGLTGKPALLLGMDALRLFDRVSIDFANRNVRFILKGNSLRSPAPMLAGSTLPRVG